MYKGVECQDLEKDNDKKIIFKNEEKKFLFKFICNHIGCYTKVETEMTIKEINDRLYFEPLSCPICNNKMEVIINKEVKNA